ncbi:MAG TPA: AI-2E family transporter [Azoarcus taiwanensis]|nr:AI-2E family transporter [Azoarcus taiwanensis]
MKSALSPSKVEGLDQDRVKASQPRGGLHMPRGANSVALMVLAVVALVFALHWAQAIFIPLMLAVMISYALSAPVNLLQKWHIPRAIGAAVLLLAIVGGTGAAVYSFAGETSRLIETLPAAVEKLRGALPRGVGESEGKMEKVQRAASELEQVASETGAPAPAAPLGVTRVQIEKPRLNVQDYLWMGTKGAIGFAAQLGMVLFLAFFVLVSGDRFRRKLITLAGPTLTNKKITLQVLDDINGQIQRYMLVQIFTSVVVGLATWLAFLAIGMEYAAIWGIAAGVLKIIPYLGPVIVSGGTLLIAFLQFGTFGMALFVSGIALLITSLEGYLLTPWLIGRASRMNPVVVFTAVLFWGWLWGLWGLLLGVPIIMVIKAVCDRVVGLKPVGELLGD